MRDTIGFGIDLGTTNSAIAVAQRGVVSVIKNNDGWDFTPSAVWMPGPGEVYVGRRARDTAVADPANAAVEFKLEMGLAGTTRTFDRAGVTLTPPQLSAEVLRSLREDTAQHLGETPEAAVITVPAAFGLNQNQATGEAAELAGFRLPCPLIQEPTAAAFAYGLRDAETSEKASWLVFDFGGGTFDAAVVRRRDGELQVLNHAGDPYLGGKLIDWAVVERILVPAVVRDIGLSDFHRDNAAWRLNFARLKLAAEEAKIELSRRPTAPITVELDNGQGGRAQFHYGLRRDELDGIAEPFYLRAINLCRDALADGGLAPDQIDRLLLVGSVTLAPGLRELLADPQRGLGIELDFSQEPSTVVARGAALYASTVRIERPVPAAQPGSFTVDLAYGPTVTVTTPTVAGRVHSGSAVDMTRYAVRFHNPEGMPAFHGPRVALGADGTFHTEVRVEKHATSTFTLELLDAASARQTLTPDTLSITHSEVLPAGAVLTSSMGIRLADGAFAPMLRKGEALPDHAQETFRTSIPLRKSDQESVIRIPVVEGEQARADRNRQVGRLDIRPRDVRVDLPQGSEVEVTIEIDQSRLISVVADVPRLGQQFEAEFDISSVVPPTPQALEKELGKVEARLEELRAEAEGAASPEARRHLARIDQEGAVESIREEVRAAPTDAGAAAAAGRRMLDLQAELDDLEDVIRLPELVRELRETVDVCAEFVERSGLAGHEAELADLQRRADAAIQEQRPAAIRAVLERAQRFRAELAFSGPEGDANLFQWLRAYHIELGPMPPADEYVREGELAMQRGDRLRLRAVNGRLIRLLPKEEQDWIGGVNREGGPS